MKHYDPKQVLQEAKTIAVLGVNRNEESYANKIVRKIKTLNKTAYHINPKYTELFGDEVYESLEKCPSIPDLVVFVVNPSIGIDYLPIVKDLGLKHIWLQPGTFDVDFLEEAKRLGLSPIEACVLVVGNYL
jgi:predicted CoA-binding protein